jgi:hypothetical protein
MPGVATGCLPRDQIKAIAAGRCTERELAVVRRHLAQCPRCRAAVAARAGGVRGPGDTVLLERVKSPVPTAIKMGAVAMSLLVAVTAWRYAGAPPLEARAPTTVTVVTARNEPTVHGPAEPDGSSPPAVPQLPVPDAGVAPVDAGVVEAADLQTEQTAAPRRPRVKAAENVPSVPSVSRTPPEDEIDFGIDEVAPDEPLPHRSPRPTVGGRAIRTTLD